MTDRPRVAIIGYGSILNPPDLRQLFGEIEGRVLPIRVDGFARVFNQEATWRDTAGNEKAVLNVVPSPGNWFNALLVADLDRSEFRSFRDRERGYRLVEVEREVIEPYDADAIDTSHLGTAAPSLDDQDLTLVTSGNKVRDDIAPIPEYVDLCLDGASEWGSTFLADFKTTTETNTGGTLADYSK